MKLQIIAAALPPKLDGIGDYTALLSAELARQCAVQVLTGQGFTPDPVPGVTVTPAFSPDDPRSVWGLLPHIQAARPDWVLLQYNPFSYGHWGRNLHLPEVMRRVRRVSPGTKIAIMVHEMFVPCTNWKFAVMTPWQRWQFWRLALDADVLFFSVGLWADKVRPLRRGRPTLHLPVGSNIPLVPMARAEARARLGIADDTVVLGLFGGAHVERMLDWVANAARAVCTSGRETLVLHMGPQGNVIKSALGMVPLLTEGPLPAQEISRRFAAMDIHLVPFSDGISTRRGTLMTGLQHGIATVGTDGWRTDGLLRKQHGEAFLLSPAHDETNFIGTVKSLVENNELRIRVGLKGQLFFLRHFGWHSISSQIVQQFKGTAR